jgi:hypothetical protein
VERSGSMPRRTVLRANRDMTFRKLRVAIKPDLLAVISLPLAPILYFFPAIIGRIALAPDDGMLFNVPLRVTAAQMALAGSLPLWDPYIFSGMPLFASAQGGLLFPLNWFYLAFGTVAATNMMVVLTYIVAGIGAYLFARRNGSSITGSLVTAFIWQLGGFTIGQIGHVNIAQVAAMLPWTFWSLEAYVRSRSAKWGVLTAVFVALQAFVGHQQSLFYSLELLAAYAIVMAITDKEARSRYLLSLTFVAAGVLLASVQLIPTIELLRNSLRADATYEFFTSFSLPRRGVLTFFAPFVMGGGDGRFFRAPYVGPPFYSEMVGYIGALGLMLALSALLIKRDARNVFWASAAALAFVFALGGYAPFRLYELIYHLPVLNLFRASARHLMEVEFALAILAGRGVTLLQSARADARALRVAMISGAAVLLVTVLAVTLLRPSEFDLGNGFYQTPELFVPVIVAALSGGVLLIFAKTRIRGGAVMLVGLLVIDLVLWGQSSGWRVASPAADNEVWSSEPEAVKALHSIAPQDPASYRLLTAPHTFDPAVAPVPPSVSHSPDWVLWTQADMYMTSGLQNAAGYDGFGLARYSKLAGNMKPWGEIEDPDRTLRGPSREIDLLNVRYLLAMRKQGKDDGGGTTPSDHPGLPRATTKLGDFLFAGSDLGLPDLAGAKPLTFAVEPLEVDRIALVTNLSFSDQVPDGTPIARVRLRGSDGSQFESELRAGKDTAEWAHERADIRARIKHGIPPIASSYPVDDPQGQYEGHTYVTSIAVPKRLTVVSGDITLESNPMWPKLQLGVYRISLLNTRTGESHALTRSRTSTDGTTPSIPKDDGEAPRWKLVGQTQYVDIYENSHALPRAWLVPGVRALDPAATLETIRSGSLPDGAPWDPARTALVESDLAYSFDSGAAIGNATVTLYEPNRIDVQTDSVSTSVLVLSENHYPGWRAFVDGHPTDVVRVDYNLRGVMLSAGKHDVSFVYVPKSVLMGIAISLLTAAALAFFALSRRK